MLRTDPERGPRRLREQRADSEPASLRQRVIAFGHSRAHERDSDHDFGSDSDRHLDRACDRGGLPGHDAGHARDDGRSRWGRA